MDKKEGENNINNTTLSDKLNERLNKIKKNLEKSEEKNEIKLNIISDPKEITKLKEMGFLIKLDTNGTNPEVIKDLYESHLIDYVAMDIKNSFEKYPLTVGMKVVDINKIKESINYLMTSGIDYEFRTTLIDEYHNEEDMKEISEMIKGAKSLYLQKYVDRESCISHGLHEVDKAKAEVFKQILSKTINKVELRGY